MTLVGLRGKVEALRAVKDEEEIAAIREAIGIAERAFAMLRAGLRRDESEKDAADGLEGYLSRCGATAATFPPIVAVGIRCGLAACPADRRVGIGDGRFRAGGLGCDRPALQK